jgi:predicted MFS family arabinose efflux permease
MLAVGAGLGGLVAVTLGRDVAFVLNAASFAASAWLIYGIRRPLQQARGDGEGHRHGIGESIRVALRFARNNRLVASFLLSKTTFGVGTGVVALLAVFATEVFGAGDAGIGLLFAARGVGALVGPFLARGLVGTHDRGLLLGIGLSLATVIACYGLFPLAPAIGVAAVLAFGAHLGGGAQWTLSTLGLQRTTPDAIRGRLFSFDYGLVTTAITISTLVAGYLADAVAPAAAVWTMVALTTVAGLAWAAFTREAWRQADPAAAQGG